MRGRKATDAAAKALASKIPGIRLVWSPANQAWQVLFGARGAALRDMSVLRVISDPDELMDYLRELKGR